MKFICKAIRKLTGFIFNKPNSKENILQYIIRHFLLTDSKGEPSYTITILAYVMTIVGFVAWNEIKIANTDIITYTATGEVLTKVKKGFSSEFYYLVILLAGLIVFFFKQRGDKQNSASIEDKPEEDSSLIGNVIDTAKNIIGKLTGK